MQRGCPGQAATECPHSSPRACQSLLLEAPASPAEVRSRLPSVGASPRAHSRAGGGEARPGRDLPRAQGGRDLHCPPRPASCPNLASCLLAELFQPELPICPHLAAMLRPQHQGRGLGPETPLLQAHCWGCRGSFPSRALGVSSSSREAPLGRRAQQAPEEGQVLWGDPGPDPPPGSADTSFLAFGCH